MFTCVTVKLTAVMLSCVYMCNGKVNGGYVMLSCVYLCNGKVNSGYVVLTVVSATNLISINLSQIDLTVQTTQLVYIGF